jgi:hypothetical protein
MEKQKTKKRIKKTDKKPLTKKEWHDKFFGKIKGFGDGVEYQRKMRDE